jgi:hypothetical protein
MSLNQVTLTGTYLDGSGSPLFGTVTFAPSVPLTDAANSEIVLQAPITVAVNSGGQFSVPLYATDNTVLAPSGWTWQITENIAGLTPSAWSFFLAYANGATQDISSLTPAVPVAEMAAYLPETGGTMSGTLVLNASPPLKLPSGTSGYVLTSDSSGDITLQAAGSAPVSSVFGRTGAVTAQSGDYGVAEVTGAAPLASPALTGTPTAPTAAALTDSTQVATTAYADSAVAAETSRAEAAEALKAPLASPALTGSPTAPTQTSGDNSTKIATTAFVTTAVGGAGDVSSVFGRSGAVTAQSGDYTVAEVTGAAPLASPALTGTPTAPTASALTGSTQIATTAYTDSAVGVEKTRAEAAEALLAPLASPALTGTPTAPTKTALTNNTDIATTAYTDAAVAVETSRAETAEALLAPKASPALTGTPTAVTGAAGDASTQIATDAFVATATAYYQRIFAV